MKVLLQQKVRRNMNNFSLEKVKWKEFRLDAIFKLKRGTRHIEKDRLPGSIQYISASNTNNGVTDFISNPKFIDKNKLVVSTFCDSYFIANQFTASDEMTILSNANLNRYNGLFIATAISSNKNKYAFGRKAFSNRLMTQKILLPIDEEDNPNWKFMEEYIKQIEEKLLERYKAYKSLLYSDLQKEGVKAPTKWKEFILEELFEIFTGGDLILSRIDKGDIPIISHSMINNGVAGWTKPIPNQTLFNCNTTISLADRGNFYAFTQNTDFYIGTRVKALRAVFENVNKFILQFFCVLINKQSIKFSYGNNATGGLNKLKILIPTTADGKPDYAYMENYMKDLEYKKIKKYLKYKGLL